WDEQRRSDDTLPTTLTRFSLAVLSSHVGATHQRTSDREALPEVPPFPAQWSAVRGPIVGAGLPGLVAACRSGAAGTCRTAAEGYLRCHYAKRHLGQTIRTSLWIIRLDAHVGREGTMRYSLKKFVADRLLNR